MPDYVVETYHLTKRFRRETHYMALLRRRNRQEITAVDRVSLSVRAGELIGLLGPNGAGKTTLIKMLCTLLLPTEGSALVGGRDVVREAAAVRSRIGLVDNQERSFYWRLSGRDNLRFFAALYGLHGHAAERRIAELLTLVGLEEHADRRFMSYSSGMRQKLAVARGLLTMPSVLFMDEATKGLDPSSARELRAFVRQHLVDKLGATVIWVTHHLEEAEQLCDRVAIMNQGRIIACGPVGDIKRQVPVAHKYNLRVQGLKDGALAELRDIPGVVDVRVSAVAPLEQDMHIWLADERETLPMLIDLLVAHGGRIHYCSAQGVSLEEAFTYLVQGSESDV